MPSSSRFLDNSSFLHANAIEPLSDHLYSSGLLPELSDRLRSFFRASSSSGASLVVPDPGNNLGTARNIRTLNGTQTLDDSVGNTDKADVYRFKLSSGDNFNLVLNGMSADADVELIQDANRNLRVDPGEVMAFSDFGGSAPESINLSGLAGGTYYVRVSQFEGNTDYTLRLSNTDPSNLLFWEIQAGSLNSTQTFDDFVGNSDTSDLYNFNLDTASNFNLQLYGLSADADVRLIQDSNNNGLVEDSEVIASSTFGSNLSESINTSLAAGNYYIQVYQFSGDTNYTLQLSTPSEIQGTKWNDLNSNGVQDVGEPGLAGWTMYLDQNNNGLFDVSETSTLTDANGNYTFTNLTSGSYTVAEVLQPGWQQTTPGVVVNGSFETGTLTGWNTLGNTSIQTAAYGTAPTQGTYQALITNGSGSVSDSNLEAFLGLSTGALDGLGNGNATEGSVIALTPITVAAGTMLSFSWDFLTNEGTPSSFNDFAFVSIGSLSTLANTNSSFVLSPTSFNEETGYATFSYTFTTQGTYQVGLGVVDVADTVVDSALLVDNFSVTPNGVYVVNLNSGQIVQDIDFGNKAISVLAEPNDTIPFAIASNLSSTNPGTFNNAGVIGDNPNVASGLDVDFIQFQLNAGDQITIDIDAAQLGSSLDSILRLFDATGNQLAVSDDSPAPGETFSLDSYLDFTATTSGTYYVGVSGYSNFSYNPFTPGSGTSGSTGSYNIAVSINPGFNSNYGYGLVDAAAAVASAIGQSTPFPNVPNLGGDSWGIDLVNAPEVWAQGYTGQSIVVAVVDTGVDYNHLDLDANIWSNSLESNGIIGFDDDGNGYIDDIRGWDFVDNDNDPMDLNNHGTHVSGTIAAENNDLGVIGVAYNARIMPVRVLDAGGFGSSSDVAAGVIYAANNGADVINLSLGGGYSSDMAAAVQYAAEQGVVVVMAAGNSSDSQPGFPASLANQWGIAVGALNINKMMAGFSNKAGTTPLDYVVAPGVNVLSTTPGNTYQYFSGTSMATPHVAGVAALILSANPTLTAAEVESIITATANPAGITG